MYFTITSGEGKSAVKHIQQHENRMGEKTDGKEGT